MPCAPTRLAAKLVERAHDCGRLRPDVVPDDLELLLEGCAAIRLPDPERTRELRKRYLALLVKGMSADDKEPLPGPPPSPQELNWRWTPRTAPARCSGGDGEAVGELEAVFGEQLGVGEDLAGRAVGDYRPSSSTTARSQSCAA